MICPMGEPKMLKNSAVFDTMAVHREATIKLVLLFLILMVL